MNQFSLFLVAIWAWMRANPDCDFDEFDAAATRALDLLAARGEST